jgi:hypothetical protein
MKFDEKFPEAKYLDQFPFEGSEVVKGNVAKECWNCGELTLWTDISFIAHLCGEECSRQKWNEYCEALQK